MEEKQIESLKILYYSILENDKTGYHDKDNIDRLKAIHNDSLLTEVFTDKKELKSYKAKIKSIIKRVESGNLLINGFEYNKYPQNEVINEAGEYMTQSRRIPIEDDKFEDNKGKSFFKSSEITIENVEAIKNGLRPTSSMVFNYVLSKAMQERKTEIIFPVSEYVEYRGKGDIQTITEQLDRDLKCIHHLSIEFRKKPTKRNPLGKVYCLMNLFGTTSVKNETVRITINNDFYQMIQDKIQYSYYPKELGRLDFNKNPNSYSLAIKFHNYIRINHGFERVISVKNLLSCCDIPKYEDIGNKSYTERIKKPFIRDLNKLKTLLKDNFDWKFRNNDHASFEEFNSDYIEFTLRDELNNCYKNIKMINKKEGK